MKRDAAQTIFRTVVFAGAMLGTGSACGKKQPPATPATAPAEAAPVEAPTPTEGDPAPGGETQAVEDPDQGGEVNDERPRGTDVDGGGGRGRGFVLS
ncbi:MAG: hypothetical protein SFX73_04635 [Kofleriaceae bacterium]|nr:hypothetical protein [Kofleriaceae bacterium]